MEFRRGNPSRHTRHGILIKGLKPSYIKVLSKYKFLKIFTDDDNFLRMLFKFIDRENAHKNKSNLFIDPTDNKVKDRDKFIDEIRIVPWKCSFCLGPIKSRMENFSISNFCCQRCYDAYTENGTNVSELILNNSVEFTEYCKKLLNNDRKIFFKYINKR